MFSRRRSLAPPRSRPAHPASPGSTSTSACAFLPPAVRPPAASGPPRRRQSGRETALGGSGRRAAFLRNSSPASVPSRGWAAPTAAALTHRPRSAAHGERTAFSLAVPPRNQARRDLPELVQRSGSARPPHATARSRSRTRGLIHVSRPRPRPRARTRSSSGISEAKSALGTIHPSRSAERDTRKEHSRSPPRSVSETTTTPGLPAAA